MATSPMKHAASPKPSPNKLIPKSGPSGDRSVLEKSNSLGDGKPQKLLKTTRSLSPRPPVKHQHSIMVSDENDIVSVKLSPNEEFDESSEKAKDNNPGKHVKSSQKAHSETTSPNLSNGAGSASGGTFKLDDGGLMKATANNRSTSCLVYVPSDPWTRMSASNSPVPGTKQEHLKRSSKPKKLESKSFSKPNLEYFEDLHSSVVVADPWVWRSNIALSDQQRKKNSLPHQTKSLSSALSREELRDSRQLRLCQQRSLTKFDKTLTIPGIDLHFDARKKITRPKLQRSKSPAFYEELFQPDKPTTTERSKSLNKNKSVSSLKIEKNASNSHINNGAKCTCLVDGSLNRSNHSSNKCDHFNSASSVQYKSTTSITSPTAKKQPSPKLCIPQSPSPNQPELLKASLTVLNPNLLQPRHSFSTTPSAKDDELQLNIRRLSEQMMNNKYHQHHFGNSNSTAATPSFMNDTIVPPTPGPLDKSSKKAASSGSGTTLAATVTDGGGAVQQRSSSHSKINEPILETRC